MITLLLAGLILLALLMWWLWPAWVRAEQRKVDERARKLHQLAVTFDAKREVMIPRELSELPAPRAAGLHPRKVGR